MVNTEKGKRIKELRSEGKTYDEIEEIVGCSKSLIAYYCGFDQKRKYKDRLNKLRSKSPILKKLENFRRRKHKSKKNKNKSEKYSYLDVLEKIGENPVCYLTGDPIDIFDGMGYQLDHIVPVSRGGDNSIENLGICTKHANLSKYDMLLEEYLELCRKVLENFGYSVEKNG